MSGAITWGSINDKPSFAAVATSGDYSDLINTPSIPGMPSYIQTTYIDETTIKSPTITGNIINGGIINGGYLIGSTFSGNKYCAIGSIYKENSQTPGTGSAFYLYATAGSSYLSYDAVSE